MAAELEAAESDECADAESRVSSSTAQPIPRTAAAWIGTRIRVRTRIENRSSRLFSDVAELQHPRAPALEQLVIAKPTRNVS